MRVSIEINGRQALPVRAIPLLTDWRGLSPDQLAQILAGDSDHWPSFDGLTAYRLHPDGSTEPISPRWWASWVVGKLEATSNTIKAKQTSRATGRQQWRGDSLAQLPAGVFVWLDEFEAAHSSQYGPVGWLARSNPEGFDPSAHALDFNPQPDPDIAPPRLVLEGFEQLIAPSTSRNFAQLCFVRALNSADKNDAHWLGLENLSSHEAAALLCGHDPLNEHGCDALCVALLERRLTDYNESHPARRSWREWHRAAKAIGAEYEQGFDEFFAEWEQASDTPSAGVPAQPQAEPKEATPAPVLAVSASNAPVDGITTAQVAAIFDGIQYTAENWPKRLSDMKWLEPARVALGAAGGATSLWCPATLARLIHGRQRGAEKQRTLEALNRKFKSSPVLEPWRTDWDEHYEMFSDATENY